VIPASHIKFSDDRKSAWWVTQNEPWGCAGCGRILTTRTGCIGRTLGVAHITKPLDRPCDTCDGTGCDIDFCRECGDEYEDPCDRHAEHVNQTDDDGCCPACHGSGRHCFDIEVVTKAGGRFTPRTEYETLTVSVVPGMVLPIISWTAAHADNHPHPCMIYVEAGRGLIPMHPTPELETVVPLPSAAAVGGTAVRLDVHTPEGDDQ